MSQVDFANDSYARFRRNFRIHNTLAFNNEFFKLIKDLVKILFQGIRLKSVFHLTCRLFNELIGHANFSFVRSYAPEQPVHDIRYDN